MRTKCENVSEILGLPEQYRVVGFLVLGDAKT